jgi:thioredoxin 1
MKKPAGLRQRILLAAVMLIAINASSAIAGEFDHVPVKGLPTLVVLGTPSCPPCIRMKPVLEKLASRFSGRAAVVPINVAIHNDQMIRFGVKAIPVEIFFNADGREVYRQLGFMSEREILDQLKKLGVE